MTRAVTLALAGVLALCGSASQGPGVNPHPVRLVRPAAEPLSAVAQIGRDLFFDARLSASGTISCATCHDPAFAYGPSDGRPVHVGGASLREEGVRAVPSLRYLDRAPAFAIGPDVADADGLPPVVLQAATDRASGAHMPKVAGVAVSPPLVPRGGLFWDGRADSLQAQADGPLLNAAEMANRDAASLAAKFRGLGYSVRLARALGLSTPNALPDRLLFDDALFAIARFEFEDPSFHPYSSRYDAWLEGRAVLNAAELRGLRVFEDPAKGNCAACHPNRPAADGRPPVFTDWQYEAIGVPRNEQLAINHDPAHVDLGLCGPDRTDLRADPRWCGLFRTPSLRNVATRRVFFHNGVYHTLADVLRFYSLRAVQPERVYPAGTNGSPRRFDDLPASASKNLDVVDAPFNRRRGDSPPMTDQDIDDLIGFLQTLTDR